MALALVDQRHRKTNYKESLEVDKLLWNYNGTGIILETFKCLALAIRSETRHTAADCVTI